MRRLTDRYIVGWALIFALVLFFGRPLGASAAGVDHSLYSELLQKYVKKGVVDYEGFKEEEVSLDQYLSIFKWYSEDFNKDIAGFFMKYAGGELKERLQKHSTEIKVEYLDYDWSLNGQ